MLFAHPPIAEHLLALVLKFDSLVLVIACSAASASVPASGFKDICSCGLKFDSLVLVIACSIHLKKKKASYTDQAASPAAPAYTSSLRLQTLSAPAALPQRQCLA